MSRLAIVCFGLAALCAWQAGAAETFHAYTGAHYATTPGYTWTPGTPPPEGSCIAVCATDAPLTALQLKRLSLRPLLGLARAGSYASNGSGEIGLAFTVTRAVAER